MPMERPRLLTAPGHAIARFLERAVCGNSESLELLKTDDGLGGAQPTDEMARPLLMLLVMKVAIFMTGPKAF
jgi:hypothetical protein